MVDLPAIQKEYKIICQQLSNPELISDSKKIEKLLKKKSLLEKIIAKIEELKEIENKISEDKSIIASQEEPELAALAESELLELSSRKKSLEQEIENLLKEKEEIENKKPKEKYKSAIIEIRAGTGGEEAALFARDLFRMYSKYANSQGWGQKVLESRESDLKGFKEIIFELSDTEVFSKMKYEGGVHRVQRIPDTEKAGRIHTSTATVAVLPKPKKAEIQIDPKDLRIDYYRASGPGGQYVNRRETAVRITHLPTGLVVTSQTERNQLTNKENAIKILEARLLERKLKREEEKIGNQRKTQIGRAQRPEKIRTYNFPQNRVTDHRIKKSWKSLQEILDGKLEPVIKALKEKLENGK